MTSFPHSLVLDSQPRFGLAPSECSNLFNFLINQRVFMKLVAKCSSSVSLSGQVHVKVCNPISLNWSFLKLRYPIHNRKYVLASLTFTENLKANGSE